MREIKFDFVWKSKKFGFIHNKHTLEEIMGGDHYDAMSDNPMLRDCVLIAKRQYTGIKDKNGVEIYEGDIVNFEEWHGGMEHAQAERAARQRGEVVDWTNKYVVVWEQTSASGQWVMVNDSLSRFNAFVSGEVVGNIHEHPELLEDAA